MITQRGRRVIVGAALLAGFGAGMTAQLWNPYTRQLDHCATARYEDGSAATSCAGAVVSVSHADH